MKHSLFLSTALLMASLSPASAMQFKPFNALQNGKDCRIKLEFPVADFCGHQLDPQNIRGWLIQDKNAHMSDKSIAMIMGQKYVFTIYETKPDNTVATHNIVFLNPSTAKRFFVQHQIWSGKESATQDPFPHWLELGD